MLINCPECNNQISDKALQCPHCGLPLSSVPSAPTKPKISRSRASNKPMRLPNGFGQIKKLSGKRRKPYAVYPPTKDYKDNGQAVQSKALGYFATYNEAYNCLSEYNKNPYDVETRSLTFAEVYELFKADKFNGRKQYSKSTANSYTTAYNNCKSLHNEVYRLLKTSDYQTVIDNCTLKHSSLELILILFKQVEKFAIAHDITDKSYAQYAQISIADDDEHGVPFTEAELTVLWSNTDDPIVRQILVLCYSGFRVSAYQSIKIENGCFNGGVKNEQSKRLVPIHSAIAKWSNEVVGLVAYSFRNNMYETLSKLKIERHTPHDCRHTFSWLLSSAGVDDFTRHLLMGHTIPGDVEAKVYTHKTIEELTKAINSCRTFVPQGDIKSHNNASNNAT